MDNIYQEMKKRIYPLLLEKNLLNESVKIKARALSTEEAIGNPESEDFPLQKGKERLMQAEFLNGRGQAFTDLYGDFEGSLSEIMDTVPVNNFRRAVFVATLNAVLDHLKLIDRTVHCRDHGPAQCGEALKDYINNHYGWKKILQIGFQPAMVKSLSSHFPLRVIDLDPLNIGSRKFQKDIEGPEVYDEAIEWADILLVTGSTIVNGTIETFLTDKPVIFYGTTIAGPAHLMGWERFCNEDK